MGSGRWIPGRWVPSNRFGRWVAQQCDVWWQDNGSLCFVSSTVAIGLFWRPGMGINSGYILGIDGVWDILLVNMLAA